MVSIRKVHQPECPDFDQWLASLALPAASKNSLRQIAAQPERLLVGQEMVEILLPLHMDDETLQAALLFPFCEQQQLNEEQISEQFGAGICQLVVGVRRMDAIRALHSKRDNKASDNQTDSIRRMLLAMVEDVRAMVIKLAERICALQQVKNADEETRVVVARECANIYAPLANRLGIGQLKWELEDLSFRYLHPHTYKQIAGWLEEKRAQRESYIEDFVSGLQDALDGEQIKAQVYGRPKHIFSIYKKMHNKQLDFSQLYDIRAVRIIAERLQDCYAALGVVHAHFKHIAQEFDDYIATPKPNGYQSIHTVVAGPEQKSIEIQIRTQQMHEDAELGVAAHWKYKEGGAPSSSAFEQRINWLRKILAWQEEVAESGDLVEELRSQVFDDRVYVFTPQGDVVDLPKGATPLDFAYYVHTNVGHRCVGAKINGRIVPFTHVLQSGDKVEILTGKDLNPSRDWMHPGLGYVHSSRARAKIQTFFKQQDKSKNRSAGKEILEQELQKVGLAYKEAEAAIARFNLTSLDDLSAAIGGGDVRIMQVVNYLVQLRQPKSGVDPRLKTTRKASKSPQDSVVVQGVGNLLSQMAKCCSPLPGDAIAGYITMGKGVSVHRANCEQFQHLLTQYPERQVDVSWVDALQGSFQTQVNILGADHQGLMRDITTVLANDKVTLLGINSNSQAGQVKVQLTLEVKSLALLSKTISRLQQLKGVSQVIRLEN